jgi:hypothetical protein
MNAKSIQEQSDPQMTQMTQMKSEIREHDPFRGSPLPLICVICVICGPLCFSCFWTRATRTHPQTHSMPAPATADCRPRGSAVVGAGSPAIF